MMKKSYYCVIYLLVGWWGGVGWGGIGGGGRLLKVTHEAINVWIRQDAE